MIEHHCRKGLRPDCDCDFCIYKRKATASFSFLRRRFCGPWDGDQEYRVREEVRAQRRRVRAELNRLKEAT